MAHRSQCSSAGDNPLDPNYLPPHYREEYRMAIDALVDGDLEGYYGFLQDANVVDFLSQTEIEYIKCRVRAPHRTSQSEKRYMAEDGDGSSDTYWPVHSDLDAPSLDLGWPQQLRFVGPTEVTTLVNPPDPEMPSIKEQVRRMIKNAQQVIAVVMDMFTDVDIFADILNAAMRGVAVYILLDELNAHHFVLMANNCRVNLDEMKFMRVRTVPGTTYFCHTGKSFKGQMMDRFILVDCRAVLTGNYSFMWSFEKIHRCLAHLFLGQLVTTFDEEFRILFAHSEPLVVEKVLANMSHYSNIQGHLNMEKTHMFNREFPKMLPERAGHFAEDHMNAGDKMLPFRNIEPPTQPFREGHPFMEHGRQMRGPIEMSGFKRHGYPDVPDYGYMPPQNQPTMRGKQFIEGVVPKGGHFAREPSFYQGAGLQPDYDMYGRFRGQGHQIDQFPGAGYPHEVNEAEPPGAYDHVQRYLQSQPPMEEGHGARNVLTPAQSNTRRHSMGQSYACQTSPTQPNLPDQKRLSSVNHKPQDVSQKQGLRDWRISSYLSAFDDGGDMDFPDLEGSDSSDNAPCFVPEGPGGPMGAEIRPGNIEFNKMMLNSPFFQIRNSPSSSLSLVDHPPDLPENIKIPIAIKTPPTSESSCTTEGDKVEEMQNKKPKEINLFGEEFLRSKPTRAVPRSSRLRHSLIFSSNLELNTSGDSKDALGENDGDEASKLTARVSQIMDKRRSSAREPFQWSNFVRSATIDDQAIESTRSETSLNKIGVDSDVSKVDNSQDPVQGKNLPETVQSTALEEKSKRDEAKVWQMSSFVDMNDPDSRLRYFKELAAQRKAELAAAKASQSNPEKAPKKPEAPEKPLTSNVGKKAPLTTPMIQDAKCEESSEDMLHRATDTEKIRIKQKLAEESLNSFQKDTTLTLNPAVETRKETQKCGKSSQPVTSSPSKPFSRNVEALSAPSNAVDSSSIQYSATVDSLVGSKLINTDPSLAVSTTGKSATEEDLSQKPITVRAESSQQPTAKGEQTQKHSSQQSTATENEPAQKPFKQPTPMKTDSSQHPSAAESSSSQTLATTKTDPSQNPTVMKAESSQQFSATESATAQKQAAMNEQPFKQPTAVKSKSFQQPTAKDANSFQQPTATENKHAQKLPAMEADSSQLSTSAETDSSLQPNALEVRSSMLLTATENEHAHKPDATEAESFQHLPENKHAQKTADSLPHPFATENETSQKTSATETESVHHSGSTENKPAQKSAMETESVHHSGSTENKPTQKSIAMETGSLQHSPATEDEHVQKPDTAETESVQHPCAKENEHVQESIAMETGSLQHSHATEDEHVQKPDPAETESVQHPCATENEHAHKPDATEAESFQHLPENKNAQKTADSLPHPFATENGTSQKTSATETESVHHSGSTENKPAQKSAMETESVQHPGSTENKPTQKSIAMETGSLQHSHATEDEHAQKPDTAETESVRLPCATDSEHAQKTTAMKVDSCQQPTELAENFSTATEKHSQNPTATEAESFLQPTLTETDSSQNLTAAVRESLQQPTATGTDASQQPSATESELAQKPTSTDAETSQQPVGLDENSKIPTAEIVQKTATEGESLQQSPATENKPAQKAAATGEEPSQHHTTTDPSQQPTLELQSSTIPTATENVQNPDAAQAELLQHLPAKESNSSQQPTEVESELIQESTSERVDCFQQSAVIGTDDSQKSSSTEADVSQQSTSEERQSSERPKGANSFQKPSALEEDPSQHPTTTKNEPSQHPTETLDDSQNPTETVTDSSHKPNSKLPISIECESIHHPTDTKCVSASHSTLKVTLSPQTISFSDTFPGDSHILFQTGSVGTSTIETNNQNILITTVCTIQSEHEDSESKVVLPTITSSETQETSSATSEQKGDNVCQDVSKQGTILTTNITPGLSQSIITDSSSSAEVHKTEKPCPQTDDGKIELNSSLEQAQVKASITSAVNDADNVVVSLNSVAVSSNELHDSTEPDTTQQSVTSSVQESSSLNDPKPQDENQKHEEQPQRHDSSAIPQGSEIAKVSTSATNQTTPENCVSNLSEKSESAVTPNSAENAKSQSAVTENPKPIPSAHQSSTANVISCSNLRDDTKVLLEQISAKNQRTKQAANEEKEGGVKSGGQELSSFLGRSWTSKASAEEKEMLLQKMEKMRKERKVYSRFEAS